MFYLVLTVLLTVVISAFCSTLEAMILSTTPIEIEALRKKSRRRGELLEKFVSNIDETTSAILTANTIANTFGATLAGTQFAMIYGDGVETKYIFPAAITVTILFFSEILPKNFGILYRPSLQPLLVYPLHWLRTVMMPVSRFSSWFIGRITTRKNTHALSDAEIILLAEKGEKEGLLTPQERDLIANSLSLADITIAEIMTPRTVVTFLKDTDTVAEACRRYKVIPFARIPVYRESIDDVVGVVRRRDIMQASAEDRDGDRIGGMTSDIPIIPETASALDALQLFLKAHQQLALVVDEFGSTAGVVTMEDVIEHLLGREIYEDTDMAIDMRELARRKARKWAAAAPESKPEATDYDHGSENGSGGQVRP